MAERQARETTSGERAVAEILWLRSSDGHVDHVREDDDLLLEGGEPLL